MGSAARRRVGTVGVHPRSRAGGGEAWWSEKGHAERSRVVPLAGHPPSRTGLGDARWSEKGHAERSRVVPVAGHPPSRTGLTAPVTVMRLDDVRLAEGGLGTPVGPAALARLKLAAVV